MNEDTIQETKSACPEAPASVTVHAYYKGFSVMLTKRDEAVKVAPLLLDAIVAVDWMTEHGFVPSWNPETNAAFAPKQEIPTVEKLETMTAAKLPNWFEKARVEEEEPALKLCAIHDVPMKKRTGTYGEFWSHGRKKADGTWENCNDGKGYK